MYISVQ